MAGLVGWWMTWTSTDMGHRVALHPDLAQWAVSPGGVLFCTRVREHIANGGKLHERFVKPPQYGGAPSLRFRIYL